MTSSEPQQDRCKPSQSYTPFGGWASRISLWRDSETWGSRALVRSRKIPHSGNIRAKTKLIPLGSLNESETRLKDNCFCSCLCRNPLYFRDT